MIPRLTTKTVVGQRSYNFGFDYIARDFVKVEVDGKLLEYDKDYTVNGSTVEFVVTPTEVKPLYIYRDTTTIPLVDWKDSSIMTAKDMNIQQTQHFHIAEELAGNTLLAQNAVHDIEQMRNDVMRVRGEVTEIAGGEFLRLSEWNDKRREIDKQIIATKEEITESLNNLDKSMGSDLNSINTKIGQVNTEIQSISSTIETNQSELNKQLNILKKGIRQKNPIITPLVDWERLAKEGTNITGTNTEAGVVFYHNAVLKKGKPVIYLKDSYKNYDAILIEACNNTGWYQQSILIPTWQLEQLMSSDRGNFYLSPCLGYIVVCTNSHSKWNVPFTSTETEWIILENNMFFVEIKGVKYIDD